jgi:hypothetical protein
MATVNHYFYYFYHPNLGLFNPGTARTWMWGPWPWSDKGVVVTAHAFNASTQDRALAVTDVQIRTIGYDYYLVATVRNVGRDPLMIYWVYLSVVGP